MSYVHVPGTRTWHLAGDAWWRARCNRVDGRGEAGVENAGTLPDGARLCGHCRRARG